ncbi:hypothetical protein B0H16DRAFT_1483974 [Mycena metata]|uniref:Uncharacterized protein n=1 Tax=Mycena metata TaxID=1033252 RepID=A0AAD7GP30_9AGAR|nr:hypothetical protein B0H16DRAFT_1483974 [Mycena metata]
MLGITAQHFKGGEDEEEVSRVEKELGGGVQTKAGDRVRRGPVTSDAEGLLVVQGVEGNYYGLNYRRRARDVRRESGGIDEERREKEEDFEGESWIRSDLLNSDGDGPLGGQMFPRCVACAHERDAPLDLTYPRLKPQTPTVESPCAGADERLARLEEDSTIADATKPRKRSNPEQAGTVEEDSTIADATKPRTRSNTKATTVPAAPKPFKKPARRAKGAGSSGRWQWCWGMRRRHPAVVLANVPPPPPTEDPAPPVPFPVPLPRPRPRTPDAQADTADTQPEAPSLDSAIIDGLKIDLAGEEDLLEENPFCVGSYPAPTTAPPAPPAPAPAPAAPAPQPAPAPALRLSLHILLLPPRCPLLCGLRPDPTRATSISPLAPHRSRSPSSRDQATATTTTRGREAGEEDDEGEAATNRSSPTTNVAMEIFKEEEGAGSKRGKGKAASKAKSSSVKSKAPAGKTSKTAAAAGTSKAGAAARKSRKAKAKQATEVGPTDADIAFEAAIAGEDETRRRTTTVTPQAQRNAVQFLPTRVVAYLAQIQTIATDTGTSSKILHQLVGTTVKKPRKTSAWNMWQAKYADDPKAEEDKTEEEGEDEDETAPRKSYNKRSRDAFVEACGDIDPKDTAAVLAHLPELAEWRKILVEKAVADARNKGTLRTKIQTEMKPAIQILHMLLESYNVYGFGYIIDTDGDASFLFGAGENFKEMRGTHNLALKRSVKDYEHIFGEIERRKRGQPALPPVALITREEASKRDIYRQDFSRILAGQLCSKLIASVDRFAHAADLLPNPDPKSFRMLWNVKFLDMVWRCRCRIENYPEKLEEQSFLIGSSTADSRIIRKSTYRAFMPALQEANSGRATANVGPVMAIVGWDDGEYLISPSCAAIDVAFVDEKELLPEEQGEVPLVSTADSVLFYVRDSPAWQKNNRRRGKGKGKEKEKERKAVSPSPSRFRSPSPPARYPSPRPSVPPQRPPPQSFPSGGFPDRLYPSDNGRWLDTAPPAEPQRYYPGPGLHDDRAYADNRAAPPAAEPPRYYPGPGRERLVLYDRGPERDPRRHDDRFVYDHRPRDDRFVYDDRVVYRLPRDDRDDRRPHDDRFVYDRRPRDDRDDRRPHDDRLVYDRRPHDDRDDRRPHDDRSSREERDRAKPTRVDDGEVAKPVKRARVDNGEAAGPSNKRQHTMESQEQATEAVQQQTEKPGEALPFPGRGVPVPGALPWPGPYRLRFWVKTNDTQEPRGSADFYASHFVGIDQSTTADRCTYAFDPDGSWTSIPEWSTPAFASPGDEELLANFWPFSPFSFVAHKSNLPFWEAGVEFPIWTHRRNVESELPFWDAGGVESPFWEMQRKLLSFEGREVTYLRNQNTKMKLKVVVPPMT